MVASLVSIGNLAEQDTERETGWIAKILRISQLVLSDTIEIRRIQADLFAAVRARITAR